MSVRDVVILGAGPSALAAAIATKKYGSEYTEPPAGVRVKSICRAPLQRVFVTTP